MAFTDSPKERFPIREGKHSREINWSTYSPKWEWLSSSSALMEENYLMRFRCLRFIRPPGPCKKEKKSLRAAGRVRWKGPNNASRVSNSRTTETPLSSNWLVWRKKTFTLEIDKGAGYPWSTHSSGTHSFDEPLNPLWKLRGGHSRTHSEIDNNTARGCTIIFSSPMLGKAYMQGLVLCRLDLGSEVCIVKPEVVVSRCPLSPWLGPWLRSRTLTTWTLLE